MYNDSPPSHYEASIVQNERQVKIVQVKRQVYEYMKQLHGWCTFGKASFLIDLIHKTKPKIVVEIGVWGGKSLIPMACALKENSRGMIIGIDPWSSKESVQWVMEETNRHFWEYADHHLVYQHLIDKIGEFHLQDQINLVVATSSDAPPIHGIDLLHIDGNHAEQTSYLDVTKWVPLVNTGGWIILDDMKWCEHGVFTTAKASDWLDEHCIKFAEFTDICTWGVWYKP